MYIFNEYMNFIQVHINGQVNFIQVHIILKYTNSLIINNFPCKYYLLEITIQIVHRMVLLCIHTIENNVKVIPRLFHRKIMHRKSIISHRK